MAFQLSVWTDDRVELLKKHLATGQSSSLIAKYLSEETGITFTRNAILGKVHRMNLEISTITRAKKLVEKHEKKFNPKSRRVFRHSVLPTPDMVSLHPVSMMEIKSDQCRWIVDEGTTMCGDPVAYDRASYCSYHRHLGTMPLRAAQNAKPSWRWR